MRLLCEHDWPGNVRELQNYIERAVILHDEPELQPEHLPPHLRGEAMPRPIRLRCGQDLGSLTAELVRQGVLAAGPHSNDLYDRIVGQVEKELIQQVLVSCDRVQIKAAARLGINRNTLHKKLSEYRIDSPTTATDPPRPTESPSQNMPAKEGDWLRALRPRNSSQMPGGSSQSSVPFF